MSSHTTQVADQYECTEYVVDTNPDAAIISNLGTASYVLSEIDDRDKNYYMNGAMGVTTPVGLGLALSTDDQVVVLDGDGSSLMSLNALVTVGEYDPSNLIVVVWNNGTYETTGGQSTLSRRIRLDEVAESCGIQSYYANTTDDFKTRFNDAMESDGTAFVNCEVEPYSRPEEKPALDYAHSYMKHRFREAMTKE